MADSANSNSNYRGSRQSNKSMTLPGQDPHKKLFIGGLNISTTTESLRAFYEQFGVVTDAVVMRDAATGRSRCFGFVSFDSEDSVDVAQAARPHIIDEKSVDSKRAIPKNDTSPESRVTCKKVFVGGLKREITDQQLEEYFSRYGTIVEAALVRDKVSNNSRGFGFVTFEDSDSVDKVIIARPHSICDSRADVKKALSKEEMASVKTKEMMGGGSGPPQYMSQSGQGSGGWMGAPTHSQGYYDHGSSASWQGQQGNGGPYGQSGYSSQSYDPYGVQGSYDYGWATQQVPQASQNVSGWGDMSAANFGQGYSQGYGGGAIKSQPPSATGFAPYARR